MRHYYILLLALTLVACAPYNNESWNNALQGLRDDIDSVKSNAPDSLVGTDISDIQWSLVYNEATNTNTGLPQNLSLNNTNSENSSSDNSSSDNSIIGLEIEITNADTNTNQTLTYRFSNAVNIAGTSIILLASEEDLNSSSNLLTSTKILQVDTNEEIVDEATSGTIHTISGRIQRITGLAGLNLLNQLKNDEPELLLTSDIGKTEAFFLLRIEHPLPHTGQTDYTLSYSTYLMQQNADGTTWTENIITNQ